MAPVPKHLLASPSGFENLVPAEAIQQNWMVDTIRKHYERAGYLPIETPLIERAEVLAAKAGGEIRSQIYGLRLLNPAPGADSDEKSWGLRFDQTVPLARFVAANQQRLKFPFRRYVIGPVFRGERPKEGRYRQFTQADVDVIEDGDPCLLHEAEMISIISNVFDELNIGAFTIRINNRKVLEGLIRGLGIDSEGWVKGMIGLVDSLEKKGIDWAVAQAGEFSVKARKAEEFFSSLSLKRTSDETLGWLREQAGDESFAEGIRELEKVLEATRRMQVDEGRFALDLTVARGLDYYTATVFEARLNAYPHLGSVAGGGRYDDLVGQYTDRKLSGVGVSIGVTRLLLRALKAGLLPSNVSTIAPVIVLHDGDSPDCLEAFLRIATDLRSAGIPTETYAPADSLKRQLRFASQRGFTVAVVVRDELLLSGLVGVRDLRIAAQTDVALNDCIEKIQAVISD